MSAALQGPELRVLRGLRSAVFALLFLVAGGCRTMRSPIAPPTPEEVSRGADGGDLAEVLARYVDEDGRVDYEALRAEREPLDRYVAWLAAVGPRTRPELFPTDEARLAYWINAYNALVLFQVVERESLSSVGAIKGRFFWWTCFEIDGGELNLLDLENEVIRGGFEEPRVHFALNCASVGCPRLPREPFEPERLEQQLAREAERFLRESRNVAVEGDEVVLSELFEWFSEDFDGDPLAWIRANGPPLDLPQDAPVRYRPWDWELNEPVR